MSSKIGSIFIGLLILLSLISRVVFAVDFGEAYIRFDRMTPSASLSALVCATPSSPGAGTESQIQIIFPPDFTINPSAAAWSSDTLNIPNTTTAWPSISATATAVSGQTVTFAGGDLTSGSTSYCFKIQGTASTNSPTTGNKNGYIRTLAGDNSVINSTQYGVVITDIDQVTVTAAVPAKSTDFQAVLTQITPGSVFNQNSEIEYQITYGSTLSTPATITVQAEWSRGTIQGDISPSVDILDYVVGSASNGYGGAVPVIDTLNRTISWTIPVFPGNTSGQTVTFSLQTNMAYTGNLPVDFTVSGRVLGPVAQTADSTVSASYLYNPPPTPTPTITPTNIPSSAPENTTAPGVGPSATPGLLTPTPTKIPIPTLIPTGPFIFTTIEVETISSDSAGIRIVTSHESSVQIEYGITPENMKDKKSDRDYYNQHQINVAPLKSNQRYYFRVIARDRNGKMIRSDIFTFVTALTGEKPAFIGTSLISTSQKVLLYSSALFPNTGQHPVISVPRNTPYEINFKFSKNDLIEYAQIVVRNNQARVAMVDMTELSAHIHSAKLRTAATIGTYKLYTHVKDINGNVFDEYLADIKVIDPITVRESNTHKPIEHARVLLYVYNHTSHAYALVSTTSVPISNPSYSNVTGEVPLVLPHGDYKIEVSALGYRHQTIPFILGSKQGQEFPLVNLEAEPFNLITKIRYFWEILVDALIAIQNFALVISNSIRFFELVSLFITVSLIYIVIVSLSSKLSIPTHSILDTVLHRVQLHKVLGKRLTQITGTVIDDKTQLPVADADIFLLTKTQRILRRTTSDSNGQFSFPVTENEKSYEHYQIEIMLESYERKVYSLSDKSDYIFHLNNTAITPTLINARHYVHDIAAAGFEISLVLAFVFEVIIGYVLGWEKVFIYILCSAVAVIFWFRHIERYMNR